MTKIDIKSEVEKAIGEAWSAFAARHPHLAAALDQDLLTGQVTSRLADDPEYRRVMDQAAAVGWTAESLQEWVRGKVGDLFRSIVGA